MSHWIIAPILIPLITGLLLLFTMRKMALIASLSLMSAAVQVICACILIAQASDGTVTVYALGNWQPPFGIVLVQDRLSAMMVGTASVLGFFSIAYASRKSQVGLSLHSLLHFLLMGVNGAFLTGDLFNLFVFFEVFLLASYALLGHNGGAERIKATLHYVVLNLTGSSLFLIAAAILYGITGTLNMAHMAERVANLPAEDALPVASAAGVLLVVFGLKSAIFPLYFWLPKAYSNAGAAVACMFAIMTKVGIYALIRFYPLVFGDHAGQLAHFAETWVWPLALVTMALGFVGSLAATSLRMLVAYLVVISVGTMLAGFALNTPAALGATLYYLVHSTWVCGGLFLLADIIKNQRQLASDNFISGPPLAQPVLLGFIFAYAAVSVAGLPPLAGFIGKLLMLKAAMGNIWLWSLILGGSLATIIALSRAGSTMFWRVSDADPSDEKVDLPALICILGLLGLGLLLVITGETVIAYTNGFAQDWLNTDNYIDAVMQTVPVEGK